MTLTLEQVRQTRFHLARRNGYEPVDVDSFVDKVEATLSQLTEENDSLKQQVEALSTSEPASIFVPAAAAPAEGADPELSGQLVSARTEIEQLRGELQAKNAELQARAEEIERLQNDLAGSRSEAESVRGELTKVLTPADPSDPKGAVENIVITTSAEASSAVTRLLQMATEQAERLVGESRVESQRLVGEARGQAESILDDASRKAHETITDARTRAERVESEARVNAEQVTSQAASRAANVDSETQARRQELFTTLEEERDSLRGRVDQLRSFESTFRGNLAGHLENQLRSLKDTAFEPGDSPELLSQLGSSTPRLDALLGNNE